MRGKPSEIGYLNELIVKRGEGLRIATLANRVLLALVEAGKGAGLIRCGKRNTFHFVDCFEQPYRHRPIQCVALVANLV